MKNISSLKINNSNSPKTPGGISKSLLTPCRRVGLSRNWRKNGPSPFISPLSGSVEVKEENLQTRKRKERVLEDNVGNTPVSSFVDDNVIKYDQNTDVDRTPPSRNIELPRSKKSKTLLTAINKCQEDISSESVITNGATEKGENDEKSEEVDNENTENITVVSTPVRSKPAKSKRQYHFKNSALKSQNEETEEISETVHTENTDVVSTPVRSKSKKNKKHSPTLKSSSRVTKINSEQKSNICNGLNIDNTDHNLKDSAETTYSIKEKSPSDLRKECIVVIQRKIFKNSHNIDKEGKYSKVCKDKKEKSSSQVLFNSDSDSEEVPLINLNNKNSTKPKLETEPEQASNKTENKKDQNDDDEDFIDKSSKPDKVKVIKSPKNKTNKICKAKVVKAQSKASTQSSYDDEDDDFDNKKTILIRKTYEKVTKPLKAKSTGSITQKDIDELKARIEAKKKLLLAKSITPDTEELRNLIKKWQKGCQDALMELLDLMKTKFHDKQNMDYSEMLKTLKIPESLVGYDSENDCFITPNDESIILGQFQDI